MKKEKGKYPIPEYCRADCKYRDKKAEYMPACQYPGKLQFGTDKNNKMVCLTYKKKEVLKW